MPLDSDDIIKVVINTAPSAIKKVNVGGTIFTGATVINVGPSARWVSLEPAAHGCKLQVKNSSNVWVDQVAYSEP